MGPLIFPRSESQAPFAAARSIDPEHLPAGATMGSALLHMNRCPGNDSKRLPRIARSLAVHADHAASLPRRKLANMRGVKTNRRQGIVRYSARQPLRRLLTRQIEIKLGCVKLGASSGTALAGQNSSRSNSLTDCRIARAADPLFL